MTHLKAHATIIFDPSGEMSMKRDMELIREILLAIQKKDDLRPKPISIDGVDEVTLARHIELLYDVGMIEGTKSQPVSSPAANIQVKDLSWDGHDFLATLENKTVWTKIKQTYSPAELAAMPLAVIKAVGMGLLTQYAMNKAGL